MRYDAKMVLYIGYLHTEHVLGTQQSSLWGIINPKVYEYICPGMTKTTLMNLAFIAIDLPLKHYQAHLDRGRRKELNSGGKLKMDADEKERLEKTLEYLNTCSD